MAEKVSGGRVEGVDGAVPKVADQDIVAEAPEVGACLDDALRGIERTIGSKSANEIALLVEDIDDAVSGSNDRVRACRILHSISYKYFGADLLNIEWRVTHGKVGVLERPRRPQQIKAHVISGDGASSKIR